ncbi:MAG: cobalamin ABC transporter substrate-binding protein [Sulfitobacter sp.]|nr:cobalamin ABC transporter substrate-binding protein [Roseobacter sp.]PHR08273.1 MAG: cobalamin ABC transporter substrate-binding protein [Sulfitobacter sp.]
MGGALSAHASDAPRVVSMNLCTDQLVMLLADPAQIVSLSRLATDARSSSLADQAKGYPQNAGHAEEIFLSAPDVVVAGQYSDKATLDMLRVMGVRIEQFPLTSRLDQIPDQIREMGDLLHQTAKAERLAGTVESFLAAAPVADSDAPVAAFYYPNGYSLGVNTLGHDIVTTGGLQNLSEKLGMLTGGRLDLELLVLENPDVLITAEPYAGGSRSEEIVFHPALAHYAKMDRLLYSSSDWVCGTPITLRAVRQISRARDTLLQQETTK